MTDTDEYVAREMPFEQRCEEAKQVLTEHLKKLGEISDSDLEYLQGMERQHTERKVEFSNPAVLEVLDRHHEERKAAVTNSHAEMARIAWQSAVGIMRLMYGSDAVDFALAAMKHEAKAN